jgi:hypothetical protein
MCTAACTPYTNTAGMGKIRVGKDCVPLTGSLRAKIHVETGRIGLHRTKRGRAARGADLAGRDGNPARPGAPGKGAE